MGRYSDNDLTVAEIILWPAVPYRENIIVEVHELLSQSGNPVEEKTDCGAVECRKMFLGNKILVENNLDILSADPFRHLTLP